MVYALILSEERHAALRQSADTIGTFAESIPSSAKRNNETVLVHIRAQCTHVATGDSNKRTMALRDIRRLPRPIPLLELPGLIPRRLVTHAIRVLHRGGRFPPKTGEAMLAALAHVLRSAV